MTARPDILALIEAVQRQDRDAFSRLYAVTSPRLYGICLRVLKDPAEAQEALQEVYVRLWHKAGAYRPGGYAPLTWLVTMARNLALDRLRARGAPAPRQGGDEDSDPYDTGAGVPASAEWRRVADCLDELDADRAGAVRGAYLDGESLADLAHRLGVAPNTMRGWLRRSLLSLRECLGR